MNPESAHPEDAQLSSYYGHAPLSHIEFTELLALVLVQWDGGDTLTALVEIRESGTAAQYELAVNRICQHDDRRRDAEVEQEVHRFRAQRAD
jgi:hypothetical protein